MGNKVKALVLALFVAPLFVHPAAADSHSTFLTWQHNQQQKAARERGYIRSGCDFECIMFRAVVGQLIAERSRRPWRQYPAARRF